VFGFLRRLAAGSRIMKVRHMIGLETRTSKGRPPVDSTKRDAQDVELFAQHVKPLGGRLPRDIVSPEVWAQGYGRIIEWADALIASARRHCPGLPHIHFDFVFNESINAQAFKKEGRYFVALYTGTRYMLELVFFKMLSDARLFPFVPSAAEEGSRPAPFSYSVRAEEMYRAGIRPVRPKSQDRWAYATQLLHRAFLFLIGHEIAHITLGHVDLLADRHAGALPEVGWNLPTEEDVLERQAMEADADRRSVISAMASAKLAHEAPIPDRPRWVDSRRSVTDLIFDWSFAMNCVFRIFGDVDVLEPELGRVSHLPGPMRRFMASVDAATYVGEVWKPAEAKATVWKALRHGILYTELAFMTLMNQERSGKGVIHAFSRSGREYATRVGAYSHNTLARKLEPFAFEATIS